MRVGNFRKHATHIGPGEPVLTDTMNAAIVRNGNHGLDRPQRFVIPSPADQLPPTELSILQTAIAIERTEAAIGRRNSEAGSKRLA